MNHKELEVWKRSIDLVIKIYDICSDLPKDEKYGLISQMKRALILEKDAQESQQKNAFGF